MQKKHFTLRGVRRGALVAMSMALLFVSCTQPDMREHIAPSSTTTQIPTAGSTAAIETSETSAESVPSVTIVDYASLEGVAQFGIQYIDVGQADAALVWCDDSYMLIDGGNAGDSSLIYTILKNNGIENLDIVVGTHAHEDHIGGLSGALEAASASLVLCPVTAYDSKAFRSFKSRADANGGIVIPEVGDRYTLGTASINILGVNSILEDTNNTSIVFKIIYGNTSFLFTGDAEREAEAIILDSGCDLSANVLKVGHHGSNTSTSYPFLRAVMPQAAIISCGKNNQYGHPDEEVLSRLSDEGCTVYRTDQMGDIYCLSDGNSIAFSCGYRDRH